MSAPSAAPPSVTVVIACFNYADCLPEAVASVLAQTHTDFELIIVDDGSTDDSLAVAHRLAASDDRARVIAQANAGQPAVPRNRAIEEARGRYIVSLDADDRLGPEVLERCVAMLDADPEVGLAYPQEQNFGALDMLHKHLDWSIGRLVQFNFLPSATMFRRKAWAMAGGYSLNVRGYEDWDLWLGIAEAGFAGAPARGAVWFYRKHEEDRGVYAEARAADVRHKAQVIVNRAGVFHDGMLAWAEAVLAGHPAALGVPQEIGILPRLTEPAHPLRVSTDRTTRPDWHLLVDDLVGPFPDRPLVETLELVGSLGYTAVTATDGAVAARRPGRDAVACPVPFFTAGCGARERAAALATAAEQLLLAVRLRASTPFATEPLAAHVGVSVDALPGFLDWAQGLLDAPAPIPVAEAAPLRRMARILAAEYAIAGDRATSVRARALAAAAERAGLEETKGAAVLAFGAELTAEPALLAAYAATFSSRDDVTLVIVTDDPTPLVDAVAAAGLDGDDAADLVAVEVEPLGVDALFSRREHRGLPRYDAGSVAALRARVAA